MKRLSIIFGTILVATIAYAESKRVGDTIKGSKGLVANFKDGSSETVFSGARIVTATKTANGSLVTSGDCTANADADLQISLTPGVWQVSYVIPLFLQNLAGGPKDLVAQSCLLDGSNARVVGGDSIYDPCNDCSASEFAVHTQSITTLVEATTTQTFKVGIATGSGSNEQVQINVTGFGPSVTASLKAIQLVKY